MFFDTEFNSGRGGHPLFGGLRGPRMQRGDIGPLILHILQEKPMHGYEIIKTLEEKSHGMWRPSAGSVYPTLQMLEDQELVSSVETDGKKVYSVTKKGREQAKEPEEAYAWHDHHKIGSRFKSIRPLIGEIFHALRDVAVDGNENNFKEAELILREASQKIRNLTAQ